MEKSITIKATINAPVEKVWLYWTSPEHITSWAFASDDWEAPHAENDLRVGGVFSTTMSAKDKSAGFDFGGTYTEIKQYKKIEYTIDGDNRHVSIEFHSTTPTTTHIIQTFEMEQENTEEIQRQGWQAILDNFKKIVESAK